MAKALLGYLPGTDVRISALLAENGHLRARVRELEQRVSDLEAADLDLDLADRPDPTDTTVADVTTIDTLAEIGSAHHGRARTRTREVSEPALA